LTQKGEGRGIDRGARCRPRGRAIRGRPTDGSGGLAPPDRPSVLCRPGDDDVSLIPGTDDPIPPSLFPATSTSPTLPTTLPAHHRPTLDRYIRRTILGRYSLFRRRIPPSRLA